MKRWIFLGLLCMTACKPQPLELETYYLQIKGVHLRMPAKYVGRAIKVSARTCREGGESCAQHPPGLVVQTIALIEQDFITFERYKAPPTGLTDSIRIYLDDPDYLVSGKLPNFAAVWNPENRDATNDIYGLSAYKNGTPDAINYRYDFESGETLFMTCGSFGMPNPLCRVSTSWSGLLLRYDFTHGHLSEWRNLHQRITNHFNSLVYQP